MKVKAIKKPMRIKIYFLYPRRQDGLGVHSTGAENIGEIIDHVCRIIERENPWDRRYRVI